MATRFPRLSAAGTNPNCRDLPGVDRPFVHDAVDVLAGDVDVGDRVVVVGGGLVGAEVAIELAEMGKHVTIVEMLPQIMSDCAITDRVTFEERLEELGVEVHVDHIVTEIPEGSIVAVGATGRLLNIPADSVVMAVGTGLTESWRRRCRRNPALTPTTLPHPSAPGRSSTPITPGTGPRCELKPAIQQIPRRCDQ